MTILAVAIWLKSCCGKHTKGATETMALLTHNDFDGFSASYINPVGVDVGTLFTGLVDII